MLVKDDLFDPKVVSDSLLGDASVTWDWEPDLFPRMHNVVQNKGLFRSGAPVENRAPFTRVPSAGKFPYHCELHRFTDDMVGTLKIKPYGVFPIPTPPDHWFRVVWAQDESNTGDEFDVRFRVNGGDWRTWKNNTSKRSATFGKNDNPVNVNPNKTYRFQARSQKSSNPSKRSGWSPKLTVNPN